MPREAHSPRYPLSARQNRTPAASWLKRGDDPGTHERLTATPWPGNVRELKSVVHRAFIMAEKELDPEIPGAIRSPQATSEGPKPGTTLEEAERQLILSTLAHNDGDKRKSAAMLGIALKTLYNRLKRYDAAANPDSTLESEGAPEPEPDRESGEAPEPVAPPEQAAGAAERPETQA